MPGSPHRELRAVGRRDRSLGAPAQCGRRSYQMDVHNRKGSGQDGPRLPTAPGQLSCAATSQNLCAAVLEWTAMIAWDTIGYLASALVLAAFCMKEMIPQG